LSSILAPYISIVIPTYNRPTVLASCLRAIAGLAYPRDRFEVIVVDDGGSAPLEQILAPYRELSLKLIHQANSGPAAARNRGAREATGELLVFTDDDCAPAPDWLARFAERHALAPGCAIGGETENALEQNIYATASQLLVSYLLAYFGIAGRARFFPSSNLAFPTERFRDVGGFDVSFPLAAGEDRELCDRWQHRGYRMIYAPEAVVYHSHRLTAKTFLRQHFRYGCGAFYYHLRRARQRQQQMKVEPPAFYIKMLTYPFGKVPFWKAMRVAPLLVAAQAVNAVGFFWERARRKPA
jgi:cellulose synthase/poly-beta-1,6-N-acetylglucosamine synthase-like glycosyltransferase